MMAKGLSYIWYIFHLLEVYDFVICFEEARLESILKFLQSSVFFPIAGQKGKLPNKDAWATLGNKGKQ